ncbi:MAG: hypothetical protein OXF86_09035 [Caldilineaceae bacterium]|nr:hypothetical protein [Caldilineaceae bacterium]
MGLPALPLDSQRRPCLARVRLGCDGRPEYPLTWVETPHRPLDRRIERDTPLSGDKTRLTSRDLPVNARDRRSCCRTELSGPGALPVSTPSIPPIPI